MNGSRATKLIIPLEKQSMSFITMRLFPAVLMGAAVLATSPALRAQNRPVNPGAAPQAPPQTSASSGPVAPPGAGFVPNPAYPPPPAYPYPYQVMSPAGSYLTGASNVINSQGQFMIAKQQAAVTQQQAEQAKVDTRRHTIEQWQYEQAIQPTLAQTLAKQQQETYQQMVGNPPSARIWSGEALNTLLKDIQQPGSVGTRGPSIPLDPAVVSKVNMTDGTNAANVGFFAQQGPKMDWPYSLRDPMFSDDRDKIESLTAAAVRQAGSNGEVDFNTIKDLQRAATKMQADLKDQIDNFTPDEYMRGKRFLNDVTKAARALGESSGVKTLAARSQPQARTVDQLVAIMTSQGLRFAPVADGNEAAYTSLYQSLRAYDTGSSQMVAGPPRR
jgi:hypothetical protein